jgi:ER membrane protein complex subunit 1
VVTTTTGAVQLWQQDALQWSREEGLADIRVAEFVELPERKTAETGAGEEPETFARRIARQLREAQNFPQYATNFVKRFVTGSYDSVSSSVVPVVSGNDTAAALSRDTFGLRKIIVAATARGKVYGIDSSNGEVLWSRVFGLGWAAEVGGRVVPAKIFTTRTVSDGETPQVVLVTQRRADNVCPHFRRMLVLVLTSS